MKINEALNICAYHAIIFITQEFLQASDTTGGGTGGPHGHAPPLSNFKFCLNIVNLTNASSIASGVKVNENVAEFRQYSMRQMLQNFGTILSILFLIFYYL